MDRYLLMKFGNDFNEKFQLKVDHIKNDLDGVMVKAATDTIATSNIFMGKKGSMNKAIEAKVVEINYTDFEV